MPSETKYNTLIKILDKIRDEAPNDFLSYRPDPRNFNALNSARSKTLIHIFLKVKCGISQFRQRHELITEGSGDGGVDAYFLDTENKVLLLVQSKFRASATNFEQKSITADELVRMEIARILRGENTDSNGNPFNSKIAVLQQRWRELPDHAHYSYKVVILGNLRHYNDEQIKKLIDFSAYEIIDFDRCYSDLVLPLCAATFYDPKEITITIRLIDKDPSTLKRKIATKFGEYQVRVLFVPVAEIGRVMSKYRNTLLKYNPRNFLSLSKNKVNQSIRDTIAKNTSNEFALYNNGITIIAGSFSISETTGTPDSAQVIIGRPQIINGGQTAYTLSKMYEDHTDTFGDKEVMLKVIVVPDLDQVDTRFIEELSNSTNQQSRVEEADRRSNDAIQLKIQEAIYKEFGFYYERKRGEFYYGEASGYIDDELIIDRYDFLRAYMAFGGQPRWARQRGSETLFKKDNFQKILQLDADYRQMFFSYMVLRKLYSIEDSSGWGNGLRYGKMAIIAAVAYLLEGREIAASDLFEMADSYVKAVGRRWTEFEQQVSLRPENLSIYGKDNSFDFDNYYKGKTVNDDVKAFFKSANISPNTDTND